jgi:hypothetical protein
MGLDKPRRGLITLPIGVVRFLLGRPFFPIKHPPKGWKPDHEKHWAQSQQCPGLHDRSHGRMTRATGDKNAVTCAGCQQEIEQAETDAERELAEFEAMDYDADGVY